MEAEIVIIGAGAAGLGFACTLANTSARIIVVEKSSLASIAEPKVDGREIALTHLSKKILQKIGVWDLIEPSAISLLKEAKVFDGNSPALLHFKSQHSNIEALGYLVANQTLRQALYQCVSQAKNITILNDISVDSVENLQGDLQENLQRDLPEKSQVILSDGRKISARLVVAADSRFSQIRRKMGIASTMNDFSKVMLVCKMHLSRSHQNTALEYFNYGQTLALLPMQGDCASVVLTVASNQAKTWLDLDEHAFNQKISRAFHDSLGAMTLKGQRYSYPLVAVHAQTFIGKRFALIGDAAVGMHPVTAHGFNLGLRGQDILATLIQNALKNHQDIGAPALLKSFEKKHILLTRLMFYGTNGIVALFTNDAPLLRPIRKLVLKFAQHCPPIKYLITRHLTETSKRTATSHLR